MKTVLLLNLGTPQAATKKAVRSYLREFLSDPFVVALPKLIWYPILYGIILPFRSKKSAKLYQKIWQPAGSPLYLYTKSLAENLQAKLGDGVIVDFAMRYGEPNIQQQIASLIQQGATSIKVLPLYPQYSHTTTGSCLAQLPELAVAINNYHDNPLYIKALCQSILDFWQQHGRADKLLFSYHGLPKRYIDNGDPYEAQCLKTTELVVQELGLTKDEWCLSFQSRLGRAKWLEPYTANVLQELPQKGCKNLQVVCPGFAVDCLETLEEIALTGREIFENAGGKSFAYIPCLNNSKLALDLIDGLLK